MDGCRKFKPAAVPALLLILSLVAWISPNRVRADADAWISRAEEQFRAGDKAGALESFQRASWERPQDPVLFYNMGVLSESLGRLPEAVDHYASYLRWDRGAPDRETIRRRVFLLSGKLGNQAYQQQDFRQAQQWYEKAGALYPESRAVTFNLGRVYEALGEWQNAKLSYREYWELCQAGDKEGAARWLAALLRREAESLFQGKKFKEALAAFQEARQWAQADTALLLRQAQCEEMAQARWRHASATASAPACGQRPG